MGAPLSIVLGRDLALRCGWIDVSILVGVLVDLGWVPLGEDRKEEVER